MTMSTVIVSNHSTGSTLLPGTESRELETNIIHYTAVQVVFYLLYFIIFVLGVSGNILVSYVVLSNRAMHTVTNMFIMNLALSDILLCAMAVPFTPLYSFTGRWVFGKVICHLVPYVQATSVYVSTLTLTAIAVDRYLVIVHPFRQRMKLSTCAGIIVGVWAFSLFITLPYGIYMNIVGDGRYCEENWPLDRFEQYFGCFTVVMQCAVPFCVIAFCYVRISTRLRRRARARPASKNARREETDRERKRRTNRMLMAMVAIFAICWLPWNVINLLHDFSGDWEWPYFHLSFFLTHLTAMSSTCYNPFLYAWLNDNFRKEFKQVLPCVSKRMTRRFCNSHETTQDTLLQSHGTNTAPSAPKCLEPREPIAERIPPTHSYDVETFRLHVIKENDFGSACNREHVL